MGGAQSRQAVIKRDFKEKKKERKETRKKLETKWKASMAGKPITVLSPEPKKKEEPKPEPPPVAPPTKQERLRELMARNK